MGLNMDLPIIRSLPQTVAVALPQSVFSEGQGNL